MFICCIIDKQTHYWVPTCCCSSYALLPTRANIGYLAVTIHVEFSKVYLFIFVKKRKSELLISYRSFQSILDELVTRREQGGHVNSFWHPNNNGSSCGTTPHPKVFWLSGFCFVLFLLFFLFCSWKRNVFETNSFRTQN